MYPRSCCFCSVAQSCSALCDPMDCSMPGFPVLHYLLELAQTRPLSRWCHPIISSSVVPFSSLLQSFPASGSFPMSWPFASGGQSTGASALVSVLPTYIQGWFSLGLPGLIFLLSKGLSKVFSSTTVWKYQFFSMQPSLWSNSPIHTTGKTIALTLQTFVGKVMSLLFNVLSRFVIAFLLRSKRLLISWLSSLSTVILEVKNKTVKDEQELHVGSKRQTAWWTPSMSWHTYTSGGH